MKYFILIISILTLNNQLMFGFHENVTDVVEESKADVPLASEENKTTGKTEPEENAPKVVREEQKTGDETLATKASRKISTVNESAATTPLYEKKEEPQPLSASLGNTSLPEPLERTSTSEAVGDPMHPEQSKGDLSGVTPQETLHIRDIAGTTSKIPVAIGALDPKTGMYEVQFKGARVPAELLTGDAAKAAIDRSNSASKTDKTTLVQALGGADTAYNEIVVLKVQRPLDLAREMVGTDPNPKDKGLAYFFTDGNNQDTNEATGTTQIENVLVRIPGHKAGEPIAFKQGAGMGGGGGMAGKDPE